MSGVSPKLKEQTTLTVIFLLSATGIAYQVALMRIFSIAHWHHFAYMMISIAMLGFGVSGTVLTLLRDRLCGREGRLLSAAVFILAVSLGLCHELGNRVPFETFHLLTQRGQLRHVFLLYLILAWPFFWVAVAITLGFFLVPHRIGRVYFINLTGSGLGAFFLVGLLFFVPPSLLPYVLTVPVLAAALLVSPALTWRGRVCGWFPVLLVGLRLAIGGIPEIAVSEYKPLSYVRQFPDARELAQTQSPLSQITAMSSAQIRETPGQISNYPMSELGPLPEQIGLYFDAAAVSVINRFTGDFSAFAFLDYTTPALSYHLVDRPRTLVVGAGGGTDVLMALAGGAGHVTAIEVDPRVFPLVRETFGEFSGYLYEREDVEPVLAEGRGFLQGTDKRFDVIQIALLDSFNAAAAGVHALSESYLYTREAVRLYFENLNEGGVLAITRWLKTPPRDAVRMLATMAEACELAGIDDAGRHLVMIRSWNTATIILSRTPLTEEQIETVRGFARDRRLDLCWYPGITEDEVNRYTILEEPAYYRAALEILEGDRQGYYDSYLFNIRPSTDDRPYFFQFFRWDTLMELWRGMGLEWVPFMEWGYIVLVATIIQGAIASAVFILLPLFVLARRPETRGVRRWVIVYFACLGLGYMFLEIAFIQHFMLFLHYPIYAVAVVLTGFMVFSGLGSLLADRWRGSRIRLMNAAVMLMIPIALLGMMVLPPLFAAWSGWSDPGRVAVSLVLLFPVAFLMGIPFPSGLQLVSDRWQSMVPWAWGINGFASVMGASLATFTAIHLGFRLLIVLALLIYLGAAVALVRLGRKSSNPEPG